MDDDNEPQPGKPPQIPSRTEQLRILGAEEAGALVGRPSRPSRAADEVDAGQGGTEPDPDDDLDLLRDRRPRSVFESIPDAPPSFLDELGDAVDEPEVRKRPRPAPSGDPYDRGPLGAVPDDETRAMPTSSRPSSDPRPAPRTATTSSERADAAEAPDRRRRPARGAEPTGGLDDELADGTDPNRFGAVPIVRVERADPGREGSGGEEPGQAGQEGLELPHWSEPPTGQVPKVLVDEERRDDDSWSTYGASPRWRDPSTEWEAEDYSDVSDLADDLPREGALDEGDRPSLDDFFSFDDLEPSPAAKRQRAEAEAVPEGERPHRVETRHSGGEGSHVSSALPPRNMGIAVGAGVTLGVVAILLLRWGPGAMMVLVAAAVGIAAAELLATARRVGYQPAALVGLAASAGLPLAVYWRGDSAYPLVLFLSVVFTLFWYLFGVDTERPAQNAGITILAIAYVGVLGSFAALILRNGSPLGTNTLLAIIIPTVAADVGALVVGRNAGRSPLSPVSPNKTVEGALGGFAAAVVASVLFNHFILSLKPFDGLWNSAMLGVIVGIVALLGDLSESLLKRSFGVKDMGTIIPGHGGVLDRFDALLFTLPAAYYLARLLDLLPR